MLKKLLLTAAVAAVAVTAIRGTKVATHARHEVESLRDWADEQIPVEKKIAQMRKDVGHLDRDVERVKDELAREIVETRELRDAVASQKARVETEATALVARGEAIKGGAAKVAAGRGGVGADEARGELKRDVDLHLKRKAQLASLEKTLAQREKIRDTLERQLDSMARQKLELRAEIDAVEAEFKAVQLARVESKYQHDDSRLARVKESLNALKKRIAIDKEKVALSPRGAEDASPRPTGESVEQILAPLAPATPKAPEAPKSTAQAD